MEKNLAGNHGLRQEGARAEITCAFISERVVWASCGSTDLRIDAGAPRKSGGKKYKVPGICDDCGYRYGIVNKS